AERLHRRGFGCIIATPAEQPSIDETIALVKSGRLGEARAFFMPVAESLLGRGAQALLLACTELPLVSAGTALEAKCVDANLALARAIVRHSLGAARTGRPAAFGTQVA